MPRYHSVSDDLMLPSHAVIIMRSTMDELRQEGKAIVDDLVKEIGPDFKVKNVPEGPRKQRLREILRAMGYRVGF